jgi:hypothetical protein
MEYGVGIQVAAISTVLHGLGCPIPAITHGSQRPMVGHSRALGLLLAEHQGGQGVSINGD